jgi:hypothetical protein
MSTKRQIPPVERVTDDNARFALSALKERLEDLDGIRGSQGTTAVTVQELVDTGLVGIDRNGSIFKREEDEQVPLKDQNLLTAETNIDPIVLADVGTAPVAYSDTYANQQTALLNECKRACNELIASLRNGQFIR